MKFLTFVDLTQNELRNVRLQNLATAPSNPVTGVMYYDTSLNQVGYWTGARWLYVSDQYVGVLAVDGTTIVNSGTALAPNLHVGAIPESSVTGLVSDLASKVSGVAVDGTTIINSGTALAPNLRVGAIPESSVTNLTNDLASKLSLSSVGVANGAASLDGSGHVPVSQLPSAVTGGMVYVGTWNASTNTPALASGVGTKGYLYKVSAAGTTTLDGNSTWNVGDEVVFDGTVWDKIDGGNYVTAVNGRIGAVTLSKSDIPGVVGKFASNVPAITGGTAVVIAHGLATADCTAVVQDTAGNLVYPDINLTSTNVTLTFSASYAANTFRVIVTG